MSRQSIKLEAIEDTLSSMRLTRPEQVRAMRHSLESAGQLQPVIVRKLQSTYQLLDGFKRFYAGGDLKWDCLEAHEVTVDDIAAKALIMSYNQQGNPLIDYEEAQIVYSLKKEHLMSQEEIAGLLSRSSSWVSRRLSFMERLCDEARTHLQLGRITPTHARELVKLPRGKQSEFLKLIVGNGLASRQTCLLIRKYLECRTKEEQQYLLENPVEAIERALVETDIHDSRLSLHGNRLLKTVRMLAHCQHVFIGQASRPRIEELRPMEMDILCPGFKDILQKSKTITSILNPFNDER
jgi:ParB/RepB/Spo0J family partition protein